MRELRRALPVILLLATCTAAPVKAADAGAWTTYQRAEQYTDLLVSGDTVWCASSEAALQRFLRSTGTFEVVARRPDGLASFALTALARDRSGRLWIGTEDAGVSRLSADGSRWDLVSQLDGLPAGAVRVLRAVGDTLLIGTDNGIALWDGDEVAGTVPEGVSPSPLPSNAISGLVLSGDSLWAATGKGLLVSRASTGLSVWNSAGGVFSNRAVSSLAWDGSTLVAVVGDSTWVLPAGGSSWVRHGMIGAVQRVSDRGGAILASTTLGLYRWDGSGWIQVPDAPLSYDCVPSDDPFCQGVAVPALDGAGRLWVASRDGLHERDGTDWTLHAREAPVGNDVQNILLAGSRVYIATFDEGVGRLDGTQWQNWFTGSCSHACRAPECLHTFCNPVYSFAMLLDRQGRKWVAHWGVGLESFDDDVWPPDFIHYRVGDSLATNSQTFGWSAAADWYKGRWFGMDTPSEDPVGLEYYDSTGTYRANYSPANTPILPSGYVRAIAMDEKRERMWVGCRGKGVTVFNLSGHTPGAPLRLASGGGLSDYNTLDIFGVVLHADSVWVMSTSSLVCLDAVTFAQRDTLTLVGSPATRGACHPLDVAADGTVWVGTDSGVHSYAPDGTVKEYTMANSPIAGNEVRAVQVDPTSNVVWIGTATGLSRFDPAYVAPPPTPLPALAVRVYPNPGLLTGAGLQLRLTGNASSYTGAVYDAGGRRLHRFSATNGGVAWNGRDDSGSLVRPGIYFIRIESGGLARTVRVALLR